MKNKTKAYISLSLALGAILAVFMYFCHLYYVDPSTLLITKSSAVKVFEICCAAAIILIMALSFFAGHKKPFPEKAKSSLFLVFTSWLLAFLFAFYFVSSVFFAGGNPEMHTALKFGKIIKIIYCLEVLLSLVCALYFATAAKRGSISSSSGLSLFAASPVIWFALRLIYVFMLSSARVNIAGRKIGVVGLCLCVFFFLTEAKLYLAESGSEKGRGERIKFSRLYTSLGCGAIVTLFTWQVPTTILQLSGRFSQNETYILSAIFIAIILYITAKIWVLSSKNAD